jgi:hypothetical protein
MYRKQDVGPGGVPDRKLTVEGRQGKAFGQVGISLTFSALSASSRPPAGLAPCPPCVIFSLKKIRTMAKPLGPKSKLIRDAIKAHPDMGNTELAELINGSDARREDKARVKAGDIAKQKQALKKAGDLPKAAAGKGRGRRGGKRRGRRAGGGQATAAPPRQPPPAAPAAASASPVDLIDRALDLAQQCGGVAALKRLVDRLAEMPRG